MRRSLPLPILHIFRHLLREASYLPQVCRPYTREQIRSRFRQHAADPPHTPQTKRRVRQARHDLRYLWAANNGHLGSMQRILFLVFGRIGRRRRELVHELLRKEPPADSSELAKEWQADIQSRTYRARNGTEKQRMVDWLDKWNIEKLLALARSQASRNPAVSPRPEIKSKQVDPAQTLPTENIWGRPLAAKLSRSKLRKAYVRLINRVLPPVPRNEWDQLGALAMGEADPALWEMPARRPPNTARHGPENGGEEIGWDWYAYATEPIRAVERDRSRSERSRTGMVGHGPYEQGNPTGVHRYTPRTLRRLFARIWGLTPTIDEQSGVVGKRKLMWGQVHKEIPAAAAAHMAFFETSRVAKKAPGKVSLARGPPQTYLQTQNAPN